MSDKEAFTEHDWRRLRHSMRQLALLVALSLHDQGVPWP